MKRLLQIAGWLACTLLAVQPAVEGLACTLTMPGAGMVCPMGMSEMSPDCPMAQQMAEAGCMQDCCNHAVPRTAAPAFAPAKRRAGTVMAATTAAVVAPQISRQTAPIGSPASVSSSPPRYILHQVFRI